MVDEKKYFRKFAKPNGCMYICPGLINLKTEEMKNSLLFDFTVDKAAKTVFIDREFDAELSLVWDAFTKQEILDQWWAPKPWGSKTKIMNFKVGGKRFYAMVS